MECEGAGDENLENQAKTCPRERPLYEALRAVRHKGTESEGSRARPPTGEPRTPRSGTDRGRGAKQRGACQRNLLQQPNRHDEQRRMSVENYKERGE